MTPRAADATGRRERPVPETLRRDVRLLTTLLGDAIRAHGGDELFATVEALRRAVLRLHERPTPSRAAAVDRVIAGISRDDGARVARAFTAFFQLVNVAEERQRVRELRDRGRAPLPPLTRPVEVTEVLTAHPTEAKRRAVVEHLWRIGDLLDTLDDPRTGGRVYGETDRRLREEIASLWLTDPIRQRPPVPLDEVRATMALFDRTIFTTLPKVVRATGARTTLRWGTWVGGDRDGNPAVTAEVTLGAAAIARDHVLRGYETAARRIARSLSASGTEVPPSAALRRSLAHDVPDFPDRAKELARTLPDAPHRRKLVLIAERLAATRAGDPAAFSSAAAFEREMEILRASLRAGGAAILADGQLADLTEQARTFGFHLASLEVRQHSAILRAAVDDPDPEVDATFRAIAQIQRELGEAACHRLVISFTRGAGDVAAAYGLARRAEPALPRHLDVDLSVRIGRRARAGDRHPRRGRRACRRAGAAPPQRQAPRSDARVLRLLEGGGVLAASLMLYEAQRAITAWARTHEIELTIFHGRGGALGRGGGPTARAIRAQPPGTVDGRFKVTEQGEVAFARYGDADIAWHHLEQLARAVASAPAADDPDPSDDFVD